MHRSTTPKDFLSFTLPDFKSIQPRILFSTSKKLRFSSHMGLGFLGFQTQITEPNAHIEGTSSIYGVNPLELLVLSDEQLLPPWAWSS